MKQNYSPKLFKKTSLFLLAFFGLITSYAQTTLTQGDIVFTRIQMDHDSFSFVCLVPLESGTTFYITDEGWSGSAFNSLESTLEFTATSAIPAGEEISYNSDAPDATGEALITFSGGSTLGTINSVGANLPGSNMLGAAGDILFIYQGSLGSPTVSQIISGVNANSGENGTPSNAWQTDAGSTSRSTLPSSLTNGTNAIGLFPVGGQSEVDNARYKTTALHSGSRADLLAAIMDTANWEFDNSTNFTVSGTAFNVVTNDFTWTGATNNDWATASNWNTVSVPHATANITIPNGLTNYPTAASNITFNTMTIASGATFIAQGTVTGSITYSRSLGTNNWYLISAPLSNVNIATFIGAHSLASGTGSNLGLAPYNNNGTAWNYLTNAASGTWTNGQGYSIKLSSAGTISFSGNATTSNVSRTITQSTNNLNLVGNPFTSFVNLGSFFTTNNGGQLAEQSVWMWNQATSSYDVRMSGTHAGFQVAPGQGFFVKAGAASTNVTFNTSNQSHQSTESFQRAARPEIHLMATSDSKSKATKIFYIPGTTNGFDNGYDGTVFGGNSSTFELATRLVQDDNGKDYAIQSLPVTGMETTAVPISLKAKNGQKISFAIDTKNVPAGLNVYLENRETGDYHNLSEKDFNTVLKADLNGAGTYYLHAKSGVLSLDNIQNDLAAISVYQTDTNSLMITGLKNGKAEATIFSLLGKRLAQIPFEAKGQSLVSLPTLNTGVYLVKVQTALGSTTRKVIIN